MRQLKIQKAITSRNNEALDRYLTEHKLTKKEFITGLIRSALAEEASDEA